MKININQEEGWKVVFHKNLVESHQASFVILLESSGNILRIYINYVTMLSASLCASPEWNSLRSPDLFSRVLFSFLPPLLATPLPPFSGHLFGLFSRSQSALFCRAKGTAQILERGSFRMDLSTKFGKEIPSRNLRENRSESACTTKMNDMHYLQRPG